jgi:integrase
MTERRGHGQGEIQRRIGANGKVRFRARYRVKGVKETIGTFDTEAEAEGAIAEFARALVGVVPLAGETLQSWSYTWLDERETDGVHRSVKKDRHACKRWQKAPIAQLPLAAITPRDVREWLAAQVKEKPARQTVQNALNLMRVCLEQACEKHKLDRNPALGVKVPKMARTKDRWTWLRADELTKLLAGEYDPEQRDIYAVAVFTGLRAGELFGLQWRDVDLARGEATVRHSWQGKPTKRGDVRRITLLTPAVEALQRQLERHQGRRYVFPARDGQPRTEDQMPDLAKALASVGITRHVRFHDLRHTCASHLLQGTWAPLWLTRPLRLEEVSQWLGHGSIAVTQRYAHLCPEAVGGLVVRPQAELAKVVPLANRRKGRHE